MLIRSLLYDIRINLAVMLGVLCASAVLTGALLVGDSMRGSLKALTLDRLGSIDTVLFAPNFIRQDLEDRISGTGEPVIYINGAAEYNGKISPTQILALPDAARKPLGLGFAGIPAINQTLADKLQLPEGDEISLRFLSPQAIPPESTFGKKDNLLRAKIVVEKIIPNKGVGRFSLKNDQQAEPLLIVPLDFLQKKLDAENKVNAVFYFDRAANETVKFKPTLDDLGISFNPSTGGAGYMTSKRMLFTDKQTDYLAAVFKPHYNAGLLYLATSIKAVKNNREVPYSTVFATDVNTSIGVHEKIMSAEDANRSIILNEWTAADLHVSIGDEIELTWFEPDNVNETKSQKFVLSKIIPNNVYTNDVVPDVKGFTDEQSIADWDPPFPFDAKKIRKKDEDYWDKYKAAPKAFVSLETGQRLWGSRFGNVTTFVFSPDCPQQAENGLFLQTVSADDLSLFNLNFVPVKKLGLAASQGTTPFSVLFLCFSFFIIASALMLVTLLFSLSVEKKAKQIGILLACGWKQGQVLRLCLSEGLVLAAAGSFLGGLFGILYACLMIYGLNVWWVGAITVPFLTPHITVLSLCIGFVSSVVLALISMFMTVHKSVKLPVLHLVKGTNNGKLTMNNRNKKHSSFRIHCSPFTFALSNATRNKTRSRLCIGLIASTVFLVLTVSVFHIDNPEKYTDGIDYIAETAFPVYHDITTPEGRAELGFQAKDEELFKNVKIFPFRMKDGGSASCLNLYQPDSPRILGIPKKIVNGEWGLKNELAVLNKKIHNGSIPVVLDQNTAQYSLHLYKGIGEVFELNCGTQKVRCEVAGLLSNSFQQGEILMSEENLLKTFPETVGWKYFLVSCSDKKQLPSINGQLLTLLGDYGIQIESTADRLRKLFTIQNTYISTFQSLSSIGLLLGTFGLAVIQVRNVFERRKELALFQAIGFRQSKIILLLLYENLALLFKGLLIAGIGSLLVLIVSYTCGIVSQELSAVRFPLLILQLAGGMIIIGIVSNVAASLAVLKIPLARELAEER